MAILYGDFPYEALGLYEAVYEINLDYLMSLNGHADVFGIWWDRRNADLRFVLNSWQYDEYVALNHFYRPVAWKADGWTFTDNMLMNMLQHSIHAFIGCPNVGFGLTSSSGRCSMASPSTTKKMRIKGELTFFQFQSA